MPIQRVHVLRIRRRENVIGRRLFHLPRELPRRREAVHHANPALLLKFGSDFAEHLREIRRSRHVQLRAALGTSVAPDESDRHGEPGTAHEASIPGK